MEGIPMNVDEAWESFIKSHQVKKTSVDEKLDIIASQMNELQTDVSRLAENIPEMQGDAAAMETANAMAPPMGGPEMGAEPGMDELGALLGGEEMPPGEEGAEPDMGEEAVPAEEGALPELSGGEGSAGPEPEMSDEELDAILGGSGEGLGAEPPMPAGNDMVSRIKELIMDEEDPGKLKALGELLTLATEQDSVPEDVAPMDDMPMDDMPVDDGFLKSAGDVIDTPKESVDAVEDAVGDKLEDAPDAEETKTMETSSVTKSAEGAVLSKVLEALTSIVNEISGATGEDMPLDLDVDPVPVEDEAPAAIVEDVPAIPDEPAPFETEEVEVSDEEVEGEDEPEEKEEEGSEEKESEGESEEAASEEDESEEDESEDDESEEDEGKDPEDDISEETDHFEESDCEESIEKSLPVMKSFKDLFSERIATKAGVDGKYMKTPAYMKPSEMKDGFANGKHIASYEEVNGFYKSDRPDVGSTVNGDISRPELGSIKKSSGQPPVTFKELMNAADPHELMKADWDDYNLFKSRN